MKFLRLVLKQNLGLPVFRLVVASGTCCALIAYRIFAGCEVRHAYLIWNLFLAWLPLLFALHTVERFHQTADLRDRKFLALGVAWLLFFPNAPYIFTDLVHVLAKGRPTFWTELMLILLAALTGFLAGFLSLQVMHAFVTRIWGRVVGWMFVTIVCGLAAFGVYLGRFTRLNSWDVLWNPLRLVHRTGLGAWNLATQWQHTKFLILFSLFLLLGYAMLYALAQRKDDGATFRDRSVE
ncbi:MAG: hypothetical protein RLY20_1573 [Verrucomicrobiota bacterium]|jgi:uncharacterized membrane protein